MPSDMHHVLVNISAGVVRSGKFDGWYVVAVEKKLKHCEHIIPDVTLRHERTGIIAMVEVQSKGGWKHKEEHAEEAVAYLVRIDGRAFQFDDGLDEVWKKLEVELGSQLGAAIKDVGESRLKRRKERFESQKELEKERRQAYRRRIKRKKLDAADDEAARLMAL